MHAFECDHQYTEECNTKSEKETIYRIHDTSSPNKHTGNTHNTITIYLILTPITPYEFPRTEVIPLQEISLEAVTTRIPHDTFSVPMSLYPRPYVLVPCTAMHNK